MKMKKMKEDNKSYIKGLLAVFLSLFMGIAAHGQNDAINKFFVKYLDDPSFTHVNITGKMFGLFTHFDPQTEDEKVMKDAMTKIKGLKILALDDYLRSRALYEESLKLLPAKEYEELMSVRDQDGDFKFLIKEKNGIISELLMLRGGKEFFILSLVGEIDLKAISKLSRHVDIDGFQHFKKLDDN